jgi:tRNA nucleotidyltransferase (CCA-adding enzyme)
MRVYQVGGAVRDLLLGRAVQDRDWVVVGADAGELQARGFLQVGKDFPVFLHPQTREEYALARTERKTAPGYRGFAVHADREVTLQDDLRRRDLTINAMALDESGALIDPFGGQRDLEQRILRHVSAAFVEDPVRVLRVARFAARLDFAVAEDTQALMRRMVVSGEMDALVPERVWAELSRALAEPYPGRFIQVLRECGALARVLPEVDRLFGVPQPAQSHPEIDTGVHLLRVLEQAARLSPDPVTRFAALTHDLGKGTTPRSEWPHHVGHEERGAALVRALCARLRAPREYLDLALLVARYHAHCHRAAELRPATLVKTLSSLDVFRRPARLERFVAACEADFRGRPGYADRPYPQAGLLRRARDAAAAVDPAALLAEGLGGAALGARLYELRVRAVRAAMAPGASGEVGENGQPEDDAVPGEGDEVVVRDVAQQPAHREQGAHEGGGEADPEDAEV